MKPLLLVTALALQIPTLPTSPLPPPDRSAAPIVVCDGTETPCDPERPWVLGHIEKSCGTKAQLEELRKTLPEGRELKQCACKHRCNPMDPHAEATMNRSWDGRCEARCNPRNCKCPSPCDS